MTIRRFSVNWVDDDSLCGYLEESDSDYGNYVSAYDVIPLEERVAELEAENALLKERLEKLDNVVERVKSCENCHYYDKDSDEEPCAGCGIHTNWEPDFLILKVEEGK